MPTFGMLCPVFPDALLADGGRSLEALIELIRPERSETVWAEPYNDRSNWRAVRDGYPADAPGRRVMESMFGAPAGDRGAWSLYARNLYERLHDAAQRGGWLSKLRYLLYEDGIDDKDAPAFRGLDGVEPRAGGELLASPRVPARFRPNRGQRPPAPSIVGPGEIRKGPRPWRWLGAYVPLRKTASDCVPRQTFARSHKRQPKVTTGANGLTAVATVRREAGRRRAVCCGKGFATAELVDELTRLPSGELRRTMGG
ncbi:hypothetical protein [Sorangium sp. So ce406]|uniref:hypothetical protein n=1 Tax=Sorangium sp. So ce406 TaxID=3133311 RepID=UPI003F5C8C53